MEKTIFTKEHKSLVKQLRLARIEAQLDQASVANLLKRSQSYISKIESGQRRIDLIQIKKFAKIYKKNLKYFIK